MQAATLAGGANNGIAASPQLAHPPPADLAPRATARESHPPDASRSGMETAQQPDCPDIPVNTATQPEQTPSTCADGQPTSIIKPLSGMRVTRGAKRALCTSAEGSESADASDKREAAASTILVGAAQSAPSDVRLRADALCKQLYQACVDRSSRTCWIATLIRAGTISACGMGNASECKIGALRVSEFVDGSKQKEVVFDATRGKFAFIKQGGLFGAASDPSLNVKNWHKLRLVAANGDTGNTIGEDVLKVFSKARLREPMALVHKQELASFEQEVCSATNVAKVTHIGLLWKTC